MWGRATRGPSTGCLRTNLPGIDLIENARRTLNVLIEDRKSGKQDVHYGVCRCDVEGKVVDWAVI